MGYFLTMVCDPFGFPIILHSALFYLCILLLGPIGSLRFLYPLRTQTCPFRLLMSPHKSSPLKFLWSAASFSPVGVKEKFWVGPCIKSQRTYRKSENSRWQYLPSSPTERMWPNLESGDWNS